MSRQQAKEIVKRLRNSSDAEVLRVALGVDVWLGFEILRAGPRAVAAAKVSDLEKFAAGMTSWAHVDCFGSFASGVAWRQGVVGDAVIARWAHSPDRWWRRAALVSTVPLNCRARGAAAKVSGIDRRVALHR